MCKKGQQELHRKFTQFSGFAWFKNSKISANSINILFSIIWSIFLILLCFPLFSEAKVTGVCSNCHTMHNSQNGQPMATFGGTTSAQPCLLRGTCLGCHGQNAGGTVNIISLGNVPQVLHAATTDLAGGNFAYITGAKTRGTGTDSNTAGHNPTDLGTNETILTSPPGDQHATGITNTNFTCAGAKGCHGNRAVEDKLLSIKGSHHTIDTALKFGAGFTTATQGTTSGVSYRFLLCVKGAEDTDWEGTTTTTDHNEYFGATSMGASSLTSPANNTISGLCAECHGYFHGATASEAGSVSPWLRHPTDIVLPNTGEYTGYTAYSFVAPVARQSIAAGSTLALGTVAPGTDVIMCLSCHRAHASPYFKMMRWDYKSSTLSTAISGCNVCHTSKN